MTFHFLSSMPMASRLFRRVTSDWFFADYFHFVRGMLLFTGLLLSPLSFADKDYFLLRCFRFSLLIIMWPFRHFIILLIDYFLSMCRLGVTFRHFSFTAFKTFRVISLLFLVSFLFRLLLIFIYHVEEHYFRLFHWWFKYEVMWVASSTFSLLLRRLHFFDLFHFIAFLMYFFFSFSLMISTFSFRAISLFSWRVPRWALISMVTFLHVPSFIAEADISFSCISDYHFDAEFRCHSCVVVSFFFISFFLHFHFSSDYFRFLRLIDFGLFPFSRLMFSR